MPLISYILDFIFWEWEWTWMWNRVWPWDPKCNIWAQWQLGGRSDENRNKKVIFISTTTLRNRSYNRSPHKMFISENKLSKNHFSRPHLRSNAKSRFEHLQGMDILNYAVNTVQTHGSQTKVWRQPMGLLHSYTLSVFLFCNRKAYSIIIKVFFC